MSLVPYSSSDESNSPESRKATKNLRENYQRLLKSGLFSDIVLVSNKGKRFNCHKNVLSARSNTLKLLFENSSGGDITFREMDDDELEAFLKFIYGAKIPNKNLRHSMIIAAEKYGFINLFQTCENKIANSDTEPSDAIQMLKTGYKVNSMKLIDQAHAIISSNYQLIRHSAEWNMMTFDEIQNLCDYIAKKNVN